jgi:hypothetical protein
MLNRQVPAEQSKQGAAKMMPINKILKQWTGHGSARHMPLTGM